MKQNEMDKNVLNKIAEYGSSLNLTFFFCYSDEMQNDVNAIEFALRKFEDSCNGNIKLGFKTWKDFGVIDNHNSEKQIQELFDEEILKRDYVIFLFYRNFGENTMHEWNLCRNNRADKPKILLGIKHNKNSEFTVEQIRKKLNSGRYIIDVKYGKVSIFIDAIKKELVKQLNNRFKELRGLLCNTDLIRRLSPEQLTALEVKRDELSKQIATMMPQKRTMKDVDLVAKPYHVEAEHFLTLKTIQKCASGNPIGYNKYRVREEDFD